MADGLGATGGTLGQFHYHHKTHAGPAGAFRRHQDIETQPAVVGHHKRTAGVGKIPADNLAGFGYQHPHDARFAATFTIGSQRLRQHHVAVDSHFHLFGGEVQIVLATLDP